MIAPWRRRPGRGPAGHRPPSSPPRIRRAPISSTDAVLFPPPTVRAGDTEIDLWIWMRHHHPCPSGLSERVTDRLHAAVLGDPEVAGHVRGIPGPVVHAHLFRAFVSLVARGLTARDVAGAAGWHIRPAAFDALVGALSAALHDEAVPPATIEQVLAMCRPLRAALTAPVPWGPAARAVPCA